MAKRRTAWAGIGILIVCATSPAIAGHAAQQACSVPNQRLTCGAESPGGDVVVSDGPLVRIEATLQRLDDVRLGFGNVGDPAPCILGTTELDPLGEGLLYHREVISLTSGLTVSEGFVCVGPGESPVPPPPPTRQEVFDSAPIPQPVIHVSPAGDGLVGLDTWLWGENHGSVSVSVSLRGWTVTGTVAPTEWIFETSDGGAYSAGVPGSESAPVGNHAFGRHGNYQITHRVRWGGSASVSGYGLTFSLGSLGAAFDTALDYQVVEIEAVDLDGDGH